MKPSTRDGQQVIPKTPIIQNPKLSANLQIAVVRDFLDEGWPSMDLCADQLLFSLQNSNPPVRCCDIAPSFRRVFSLLPGNSRFGFNSDRLLNRHILLPRIVRKLAKQFDFIHITDHTYAHLAHAVPPHRVGVYCHDLDAFRSLLEPDREQRPWWFRALAKRTLAGLKKAAVIFHSTTAVRDRLIKEQIASPHRLVHAPYGVAEEFTYKNGDIGSPPPGIESPYLLHVGANIPRKRLDVLLAVFASVRMHVPNLRLVQIGGPWPSHLELQLEQLAIRPFVTQLRGLTRAQLADVYRHASVVLVTSDAEGFGLPVIEALSCGAIVVASDLPTLREAGGAAVAYQTVGKISEWSGRVTELLLSPTTAPPLELRLKHASQFSWSAHAQVIAETYRNLAENRSCAV